MNRKVTKLQQRLHSKRLAKDYHRVERGNMELSNEFLTDEIAPYVPPSTGGVVYAVTRESPFEEYELATEIDLEESVPLFNSLLTYRILRLLYGQPDKLGAFINPDLSKPTLYVGAGIEWGYTLRILDDLYAEIRSVHTNTRFRLRFWMQKIPQATEERKPYGKKMADFFSTFLDCIEKNAHLFNEEQEIDDKAKSNAAISNIFSEKYRAAEELLTIARDLDILPEIRDLEYGEALKTSTGGSIYLSAAILFVIALESLINTIYHLLLKSEFQAEAYERITTRADIDIRLISVHVFCDGFLKQILTPHTDLWKRLLKLRKFRNDIVHGNVTPDHYVYALQEDSNTFFYSGLTDFRGRKAEDKAHRHFPTTMAQVNKNIVTEIKETVDLIVKAIIDAANDETRQWINSWIWEAMIPKFRNKGLTNRSS